MYQSNKLIRVLLNDLLFFENYFSFKDSNFILNDTKLTKPKRSFLKRDMESLIQHFKLHTEGYTIPSGESYRVIEAPKGEFSVGFTSNNTTKPSRIRIKAPGFLHLQGLNPIATDHNLADLVTIIGTLDLVLGEIDK